MFYVCLLLPDFFFYPLTQCLIQQRIVLSTTTFPCFSSKIGESGVMLKIYVFIYWKTTTKISAKSNSFSRSSLRLSLCRGFGLALGWGRSGLSLRFCLKYFQSVSVRSLMSLITYLALPLTLLLLLTLTLRLLLEL